MSRSGSMMMSNWSQLSEEQFDPVADATVAVNVTRNDGRGTVWRKLTVQKGWTMGTAVAHALSLFGVEMEKLEFRPNEPRIGKLFWVRPSSAEFNVKEVQDIGELFNGADLIVALGTDDVIPNRVYAAGASFMGQLGVSKAKQQEATHPGVGFAHPIELTALAGQRIKQIACGHEHSVFLSLTGDVFTCGSGVYGQLGHLPTSNHLERGARRASRVPIGYKCTQARAVPLLDKAFAVHVSAGAEHTAVLCALGSPDARETALFTFGRGAGGRLGHAASLDEEGGCAENELLPREVAALSHVPLSMVACGDEHTAAVSRDGRLFTWGSNATGHVAEENVADDSSALPDDGDEPAVSTASILAQTGRLRAEEVQDIDRLATYRRTASMRAKSTPTPGGEEGGEDATDVPDVPTRPAFVHSLPAPEDVRAELGAVDPRRFYHTLWPRYNVHAVLVPDPREPSMQRLPGYPGAVADALAGSDAGSLTSGSAGGRRSLAGASLSLPRGPGIGVAEGDEGGTFLGGLSGSVAIEVGRSPAGARARAGSFLSEASAPSMGSYVLDGPRNRRGRNSVVNTALQRGGAIFEMQAQGLYADVEEILRFRGPVLDTVTVGARYERGELKLTDLGAGGKPLESTCRAVWRERRLKLAPQLFFVRRNSMVQHTPREVLLLRGWRVVHVSCGAAHTVVVAKAAFGRRGGATEVFTFGEGVRGELGYIVDPQARYGMADANPTRQTQFLPRRVPTLRGKQIIRTSSGVSHTLYLSPTSVYFSGDARKGARAYKPSRAEQLSEVPGCGDFVYTPFHLSMLPSVVDVAAGSDMSVFVDAMGKVLVSGRNSTGLLGVGDEGDKEAAREVEALRGRRIVSVAASRAPGQGVGHVLMLGIDYLASKDQIEVQEKVHRLERMGRCDQLLLFTRKALVEESMERVRKRQAGGAYDPEFVPLDSDDEDDVVEIRSRTLAALGRNADGSLKEYTREEERAAGLAVADEGNEGAIGTLVGKLSADAKGSGAAEGDDGCAIS